MRVVILTNKQPNQRALVQKISKIAEIGAVVLSANIPRNPPTLKRRVQLMLNRIAGRTVGRTLVDSWFNVLEHYRSNDRNPLTANVVEVDNINDSASVDAINENSPCLVAVSGTNIVGNRIIETARKSLGIINLHTGISPYVRGGPNCTNWCLARGWFHLIGNTVMWLDKGIDTGNIIVTEQTPLDGTESLFELHLKVIEHAHELYVRTIARIASGNGVPAVPQKEIGAGFGFTSVDWNATEMTKARRNFRRDFSRFFNEDTPFDELSKQLKLISLNNA